MTVSIFVEGSDDKRFIEDLFECLDPINNIGEITVIEGYTNLYHYENTIELTNDLGGKNYIIFDADQNKSGKIFEIKRIENKLSCSMDYYFLPNNDGPGDLEDLLIQIINSKHQIIIDCFDNYQDCLNNVEKGYTIPSKKALVYAYCEAILEKKSKKKNGRYRDYFDKELWNIESVALNPLKDFLKKILEFNRL